MLVALKRTGCDAWKLGCQASNVTASVQNYHLLHGYMHPVFSPLIQYNIRLLEAVRTQRRTMIEREKYVENENVKMVHNE